MQLNRDIGPKNANPVELKQTLDKAVKRYEKERTKKKGSLELKAAATEACQRVLQEAAIGAIQDTQTAQIKRDVAMYRHIVTIYQAQAECVVQSAHAFTAAQPDFEAMLTRLNEVEGEFWSNRTDPSCISPVRVANSALV